MARLVLFDLDGTIADTGPGIAHSVGRALRELGRPPLPPETLRRFIGPPLRESFARYAGVSGPEVEDVVASYRRHYEAGGMFMAEVYPGMRDCLAELGAEFTLAVATAKPEPYALVVLERLGLAASFTAVVGARLDGTLGAKDDIIEVALTRLGADATRNPRQGRSDVVMVGDRSYDVAGAAQFAIPAVGVGWGYGTPGELVDAAQVVSTTAELAATVRHLMARNPVPDQRTRTGTAGRFHTTPRPVSHDTGATAPSPTEGAR